jgi:hypothetical protein
MQSRQLTLQNTRTMSLGQPPRKHIPNARDELIGDYWAACALRLLPQALHIPAIEINELNMSPRG